MMLTFCSSISTVKKPRSLLQCPLIDKASTRSTFTVQVSLASTSQLTTVEQQIRDELTQQIADLKAMFVNVEEEVNEWISGDMIDGQIPVDICGSLFRNGPGLFERSGKYLDQPFDGDGMIQKFSFKNGQLHYMNRFVGTEGYLKEQEEGRFMYKGVFSTGNPSGSLLNNPFDLQFKNVANTGVLYWAGKLFAMHESGRPHELDPTTLQTIALSNVFDTIHGPDPFSAHYRIVTQANGKKRWVTYRPATQGLDSKLEMLEYAFNGVLVHRMEYLVPGGMLGFFHDALVTENYYIVHENPTQLDFSRMFTDYVLGRSCLAELIKFRKDRPGRFHIIPRPGKLGKGIRVIDVPANFIFHHSNAYEIYQGRQIVLDTASMDEVNFGNNFSSISADYYKTACRANLKRIVLDLETSTVVDSVQLIPNACEFPQINWDYTAKPNKHTYVVAAPVRPLPQYWGPNQMVIKVTTSNQGEDLRKIESREEHWFAGGNSFLEEAIFIPRMNGSGAEDDGYVAVIVHTPSKNLSCLVFLDAQNIANGPVASVALPFAVPLGLHGSWCNTYFGP